MREPPRFLCGVSRRNPILPLVAPLYFAHPSGGAGVGKAGEGVDKAGVGKAEVGKAGERRERSSARTCEKKGLRRESN